jgi:hypothetical protein
VAITDLVVLVALCLGTAVTLGSWVITAFCRRGRR